MLHFTDSVHVLFLLNVWKADLIYQKQIYEKKNRNENNVSQVAQLKLERFFSNLLNFYIDSNKI